MNVVILNGFSCLESRLIVSLTGFLINSTQKLLMLTDPIETFSYVKMFKTFQTFNADLQLLVSSDLKTFCFI